MKYHPYRNTDPFKMPEFADDLLDEYWGIAKALKIETCLIYGTCLGFVRDGGHIEGDNDIDVFIKSDVFIKGDIFKLTTELVKSGFFCMVTGDRGVNAHFIKYNILFDVHFDHPPYAEFLKSFDKIKYKERIYNVPHPVEEYLVRLYGDWKTVRHREVWEG